MMKRRIREWDEAEETTTMANYLMLLSGRDEFSRVFTCKTCGHQFPSFQALGGHRASHKKPRLMAATNHHQLSISPPKQKGHECPVCGLEFPIGQALGGHMRRHRPTSGSTGDQKMENKPRRKILCVDLNLTPLENKFAQAKIVPAAVDCFF